MTKDIDVSKIDVGWRVQLDATTFNDSCKKLHGVWATVSSLQEYGLYVVDDLEGWNRYINKDSRNFLAALPPEPAKDPFAVGEWVVCVEDDYPARGGDVFRVFEAAHNPMLFRVKDNHPLGFITFYKSRFRPATPEEIAAHLEKTATQGCEPKAEPAAPIDTDAQGDGKITFTVAGRELFVGQRAWYSGPRLREDASDLNSGDELEICAISRHPGQVICRIVRTSMGASLPEYHVDFTAPRRHDWQFGDQASHPKHGKVLVIDMTEPESFQCASPSDPEIFIDPAELTFIRRTGLGV